jgi:zinc/manganese transport system permease protein
LFGEILGVSTSELVPVAAIGAASVLAVAVVYRPLMLSSVTPDVAEARGVPARLMEVAFLLVVAAATTVTVPVVGALLIFALMIGPPAAARSFTSQPFSSLALSVALALLTIWAAVASSYLSNWPVGFFVGTYSAACYGVGQGWTALARSGVLRVGRAARGVPGQGR